MSEVPRNVILDLLPAYIAGEASDESRALVEEYAQSDPQVARLIRAGALEPGSAPQVQPPEDLEAKALKRIRRSIRRQIAYVGIATAGVLTIPVVARFPWSLSDFIFAGSLLFGTGVTFVLIARQMDNKAYRAAVAIGVAAGLLLIWINGAVGIIGSEDNPANLLYAGVLAVGVIGVVAARFRARGMMQAMFAAALAQALVPVIAVFIWRSTFDDPPGIVGIFVLNAFFIMLWIVSALLFRWAGERDRN